jgi:DNA polymerase III alpha subunit
MAWAPSKALANKRLMPLSKRAKRVDPSPACLTSAVRVDRSRLNKRTVEALVKAGAFDSLQRNRASLAASIDRAFDFSTATAANANQGGLFDMMGDDAHGSSTQEPELVDVLPWGVKERLTHEKTAVGFYLSGHLFDAVEREVRLFAKRKIDDLIDSTRTAIVGRHCERLAHHQRPTRQTGHFQAGRQERSHGSHGRRGHDQRQSPFAERRRVGHCDGQNAS